MDKTEQRHIRLQSKKLMNSLFVGNFKAAFHGRGVEFQDFRPYTPDDDARFIDWCISSKEGTTIMRRYREEKEGKVLCVVENSEEMLFDFEVKNELCHKIISLLGYSALKSGESFGGYIFSDQGIKYIPAKKNEASIIQFQNMLSMKVSKQEQDYSFLLKKSLKRSLIFIITPAIQENLEKYTLIAKKHDVILIHISTHFENTLDASGIHYLRGNTGNIAINIDDEEKKIKYKQKRDLQMKNMMESAHKKGMSCMSLDETSSLYGEFLQLMKQREGNR